MDLLATLGWIVLAIVGLFVFFISIVLTLLVIGNVVVAHEWDHPEDEDLPKKR